MANRDGVLEVPGPGIRRMSHSVSHAPAPGPKGGGMIAVEIAYGGVVASGADLCTMIGETWWLFCKQQGLDPATEAAYIIDGCEEHARKLAASTPSPTELDPT